MGLPDSIGTEYYLFGAAAFVSVLAFVALIFVPALTSFGRWWEKATAGVLTMFVFAALILAGLAVGLAIVYYWDDLSALF